MPHTTTCEVTFDDNPDRVYYGGQTVRGFVTLTLAKEKNIRGTCGTFPVAVSFLSDKICAFFLFIYTIESDVLFFFFLKLFRCKNAKSCVMFSI